ncbi:MULTISPECIES: cytosine permease [unclassified Microcella]|uniref:purine-cytosine permease family protein n=1 Tax=unclassified Microcella TaxID=2630066 RepID=UPI0006F4F666|nr:MULTISPECIES: cytosine permease [unclassified Microcella]KQV25505.1 allantoin permease [Yonghaparkia sp. Root332]KRF33686.1 allantoin permease [Yonghaparkia sp. Soil809]
MSTAIEGGSAAALAVEQNGINVIHESERRGTPRDLFWPWAAANISVFGIAYGAFLLYFGISFWQALLVGAVGIGVSFFFVGVIALAGKRGSAPTLVLSRAIFGVDGNRVPSILSWILTVGWETVLVSLAVLATSTVLGALGFDAGVGTQVVALVVVAALVIGAGIMGFDLIMRLQKWITIATGVLTIVYVVLVLPQIDLGAVLALPAGEAGAVIGGLVFMLTGFGLGWVNAAADYSRYLPRSASSRGVVGWTTFGASWAPALLLLVGLLLAGSSTTLLDAIGTDPVGALSTILPTWFLVPFAIVAVLGFVGGAVLDIYSSGLSLLAAGLKLPRAAAVGIDGALMVLGTIFVVFVAQDFFGPFQGFLITLGVPIAAWAGMFIADIILRRQPYADAELYDRAGRYGSVRWESIALLVIATAIGWGFVSNAFYGDAFLWQGYFLGLTPGLEGANLGVLISLVLGFAGYLLLGRSAVRRQDALGATAPVA